MGDLRRHSFGRADLQAPELGTHVAVVARLVAHKAELRAKDADGSRPLHAAALQGHVPVLAHLAAANDRGLEDGPGRCAPEVSPLALAALRGHLPVAEYLLDLRLRWQEGEGAMEVEGNKDPSRRG